MNLYTYGSLRLHKIWQRVAGGNFASLEATLPDHVALKVRGETYPGLVPRTGITTEGTVYLDVDETALRKLDAFEGDFYERVPVTVHAGKRGSLECDAYIVRAEYRIQLLDAPWDFEEFRTQLAQRFIASYVD